MQDNANAGVSRPDGIDFPNVHMHPITLAFPGNLEHDFLEYYNKKTLKQVRFGLFVCGFFSLLYMLVDGQLFPSVKHSEEILTYYILIPSSLAAYLLTYFSSAHRYLQAATSGVMIFRNVGTVWLMSSDAYIADSYITGLLLGLVYGASVCRLRLVYATFVSLLVLAAFFLFCVVPFLGSPLPTALINHCVDIIACVILGLFAAYPIERYARKDYLQSHIIERERQRTTEIRLALEKERVSREIHDGISSEFTGILAFAENLKSGLDRKTPDDKLGDLIAHIDTSARRGLQELRNIMMAIDPETRTLGYVVSYIKRCSHDLLSSRGISVKVSENFPDDETVLPPQIILAMFRIIQEACHNIVKHAGADDVRLAFNHGDSRLEVSISDNGKGFSADAVAYGRGIANMRKRAENVKGTVAITSSPGAGTSILFALPLP